MIHHLKIYPEHFSAVCTGVKRAELRKNDRDFKVGDTLHLMETPKGSCSPTGEYINAVVTHIADVGEWLPGYVMLSIEREPGYAAPQLPQPAVPGEVQKLKDGRGFKYVKDGVHYSVNYANGWNQCRAAMLQGAEPVSHPYTLREGVAAIRNSGIAIDAEKIQAERDALNEPTCWCLTCRPVTMTDMRFVVCPKCGNKRCPHANDHRNACTGSNEPGQEGSAYPAAPQQEAE